MKKLSLLPLSLFLCGALMPLLAQDTELVPAMVAQMADGSQQVVQLDRTAVTDFSVICSKGMLAVSMPEAEVTSVRSIRFAMVEQNEITSTLETVSSLSNATTDKVLLNGKLFIRVNLSDSKQMWYDVLGNVLHKTIINY